MNTSASRSSRRTRSSGRTPTRRRAGLTAAAALVAFVALAACAGPTPVVTVTVPPPAASPEPSAVPSNPVPSTPAPGDPAPAPSTPAPGDPDPAPALPTVGPGGASIVVTQGPVAPECTHTVCYLVHVTWKNLKPGAHDTQCVSDKSDPATWSQSTYNFPTADGERDLGCFLGKPGSRVWVVIDGAFESPHAAWG